MPESRLVATGFRRNLGPSRACRRAGLVPPGISLVEVILIAKPKAQRSTQYAGFAWLLARSAELFFIGTILLWQPGMRLSPRRQLAIDADIGEPWWLSAVSFRNSTFRLPDPSGTTRETGPVTALIRQRTKLRCEYLRRSNRSMCVENYPLIHQRKRPENIGKTKTQPNTGNPCSAVVSALLMSGLKF
jgi:hypothetical protein